jgi:hypothetical protein
MRMIAACALALFAESATAENLVVDDADITYSYTYQKLGSQHFCDLATFMTKAPMLVKLTAAYITDETAPKDHTLTVAYIVEAFVARKGKNSQWETVPVKVTAGRIISKIFHSDLGATKNNTDKGMGATYIIPSEGMLALFTSVVAMDGAYTLAVEFENRSNLIFNVRPTEQILDASTKWTECSIAIMENRTPR